MPFLRDHSSSAIVAVSDYQKAKAFYRDTLKLELVGVIADQVMTFRTGATRLIVYVSGAAGSNRANAVVWGVGSKFDAVIDELKSGGVEFEHYGSNAGMHQDGDIHRSGDMKLAWFKDPDGNILHVNNM